MVDFVGCGPGDPDLITVKAKKIIQRAEVVVYSGSLIPKEIVSMCKKAKLYDASKMVRGEITDVLLSGARARRRTVRLHDGDPTIYGAIREQIDALASKGVKSQIIPGVTSFLASAAALGAQLTLPGVTQTIIVTRAEKRTRVPKKEQIRSLAGHGATMIFYLSVHLLSDVVSEALAGGYKKKTPAAVVYRASWKDQKIIVGTLADIAKKVRAAQITRTAIIVIGDAVAPTSYEFSRLYDASFGHGYRKASRSKTSAKPSRPRAKKRTRSL